MSKSVDDIIYEHKFDNAIKIFEKEPWKSWLNRNLEVRKYLGKDSVALYSYQMDSVINFGMRNNRLSELGFVIAWRLIDLIGQAEPIPEDIYLFRGIKTELPGLEKGKIIDLGFSSKSLSPDTIGSFINEKTHCRGLVVKYNAKSVPMIYLETVSDDDISGSRYSEFEMLTFPGEVLDVKGLSLGDFGGMIANTYTLSHGGFQYKTLPNELLHIVDLNIDRDFKVFYNNMIDMFKTYEVVKITFLADEEENSIMILPPNSPLFDFFDSKIVSDYIRYFYNIYSKFCGDLILRIEGLNGINNYRTKISH